MGVEVREPEGAEKKAAIDVCLHMCMYLDYLNDDDDDMI